MLNYEIAYELDAADQQAEIEEERKANRELQLRIYREKLKRERRSQRFTHSPEKPVPSLARMFEEIRRISMGGVLCTMAQYDHSRPADWPTAKDIVDHTGVGWEEIGAELGLRKRATWTTNAKGLLLS